MFCVISMTSRFSWTYFISALVGFSGGKNLIYEPFDIYPVLVTCSCPTSELEYVAKKILECSLHLDILLARTEGSTAPASDNPLSMVHRVLTPHCSCYSSL